MGLALLTILGGASALTGRDGDGESDRGGLTGSAEVGGADVVQPRRPDVADRADRSRRDDSESVEASDGRPPVFARYEKVILRLPTIDPLGVHFTQGRRVGAVPLRPRGTLTANADPEGFDPSRVAKAPEGPEFAVAAPAGRGRPATSAAVVSVGGGDWVRAPISGTIEDVSTYPAANGTDWRVVLSPESRPELHVTLTGLHRPQVEVDDTVAAGDTLAAPRLVADSVAQVAIEVGPAGAPITMDVDEATRR